MASLVAFLQDVGWEIILTSILICLSVFWYVRNQWLPIAANLPPGPPRIPFPFSLIAIALTANKGLQPIQDLKKRYGDIVFFHLGDRPVLFIFSYDLVKEILVERADVTSDRRLLPALDQILHYDKGGILFSSDEIWQEYRRFAFQALRSMGMGKRTLEDKILEEANYLLDEFSQRSGQPFYPRNFMYSAVSNIICSIVFGHRFEYSDARFKLGVSGVEYITNNDAGLVADIPLIFLRKVKRAVLDIKHLIDEEIAAHETRMLTTDDVNDKHDVIDMFLAEVARTKADGEATHLKKEHFWSAVFDLFLAGTETSSTTLTWAMLFLVGEKHIQDKVVEEVDRVIGSGRKPCYENRKCMPYTQAFILETLRFRPTGALGVPHLTTADLTACGYHVPKGTDVLMNILAIHHDPKLWDDPEVFRPERFISPDGKSVLNRPEWLPFGAGRRICIGEQLAKMELFLFITLLVQRFSFRLPDGVVPDYGFGKSMPVISPNRYDLICSKR